MNTEAFNRWSSASQLIKIVEILHRDQPIESDLIVDFLLSLPPESHDKIKDILEAWNDPKKAKPQDARGGVIAEGDLTVALYTIFELPNASTLRSAIALKIRLQQLRDEGIQGIVRDARFPELGDISI